MQIPRPHSTGFDLAGLGWGPAIGLYNPHPRWFWSREMFVDYRTRDVVETWGWGLPGLSWWRKRGAPYRCSEESTTWRFWDNPQYYKSLKMRPKKKKKKWDHPSSSPTFSKTLPVCANPQWINCFPDSFSSSLDRSPCSFLTAKNEIR